MSKAQGIAQSANQGQFKNRIINGAMMIDQRNAGASVTVNDTGIYTLDRWVAVDLTEGSLTVQQIGDAPSGFTNSLRVTVTSADASLGAGQWAAIRQPIEGFNVADLGYGTANAQTITLSFWVKSSLTGTFGGSLQNGAQDRGYPFTYTISAANTWEYKTVTAAGDTTGTWLTNNGVGLRMQFSIGSNSANTGAAGAWAAGALYTATGAVNIIGTSGATFQVTGVQLEKGSTATSFDYRPYGTELQLCQRYYEKTFDIGTAPANNLGSSVGEIFFSTIQGGGGFFPNMYFTYSWKVPKRATPTLTVYNSRSTTAGTVSTYDATTRADSTITVEGLSQNQVLALTTRGTLAIGAFVITSEL